MIPRLYNLSLSRSFFLFGPRGVGKSTLLKKHFATTPHLSVNLLEADVERRLSANPDRLLELWSAQPSDVKQSKWVVIDEIQRVPRILDVVHRGIEDFGLKFAMTGSNARKLRRGAANLLAGRASEFRLHPFSFMELGADYQISEAMTYGLLPTSYLLREDHVERRRFLNSYVNTYLREEIQAEQIVKNMEPFRQFIEIAGAAHGKILNASKVGRQCGIDPKTSQRYFQVLVDTLVGFYLPAFSTSIRKQQASHPKFYWFDAGVARAAAGLLDEGIEPGTYDFGNQFESLVIVEAMKLNDHVEAHATFSYFHSADGAEIDLIIKKGRKLFVIEIKSSSEPDLTEINKIARLSAVIKQPHQAMILCTTRQPFERNGVLIVHWMDGLRRIFGLEKS
jgi:predicted AAA+ superfamily ATPase